MRVSVEPCSKRILGKNAMSMCILYVNLKKKSKNAMFTIKKIKKCYSTVGEKFSSELKCQKAGCTTGNTIVS